MLTHDDVDTLDDLFELRAEEMELPDGTFEKVQAQLRGKGLAKLTAEEAEALLDLVSEFSQAAAEDPGAADDPDRVDYAGLEFRLRSIAQESTENPAQSELKRSLMR